MKTSFFYRDPDMDFGTADGTTETDNTATAETDPGMLITTETVWLSPDGGTTNEAFPKQGIPYDFCVTVQNSGQIASGPFTVKFVLSGDQDPQLELSFESEEGLDSGASVLATVHFDGFENKFGIYHLSACIYGPDQPDMAINCEGGFDITINSQEPSTDNSQPEDQVGEEAPTGENQAEPEASPADPAPEENPEAAANPEEPLNEQGTSAVQEPEAPAAEGTPIAEQVPVSENTASVPLAAVVIDWKGNLNETADPNPAPEKAAISTSIKSNRDSVPVHLTDKNKVPNGYMYDPFAGIAQPQPSAILPNTVEAWIWEELRSEGSYTSINTYDNMVVTWGRGIAGGNVAKLLKSVFSTHPDVQEEFNQVGIGLDDSGILTVVDTDQNCIKKGPYALQLIKGNRKLLDFLVDVSLNDKYKDIFLQAQWDFVKTNNASLIAFTAQSAWSKSAVQLAFHFNWWLPAHGWLGHQQEYKNTGGDPSAIIRVFANHFNNNNTLTRYLKIFAGNAFSKYVALEKYKTEPASAYLLFEDAGTKYYFPN